MINVAVLATSLVVIRLRLEGKLACEECGCEMAEEEVVEGEDGEMLCEECAAEMYESIECPEGSEALGECSCDPKVEAAVGDDDLTEKAMSKFKKLVGQLKKKGASSPEGLASYIGAKKLGKGNVAKGRKMLQKMGAKARKSA